MNTNTADIKTGPRATLTRADYEAEIRRAMLDPTPALVDEVIGAHAKLLSEGLVDRTFAAFKKRLRKAELTASQKAVATTAG